MMKRRWSNNGGGGLVDTVPPYPMLEESSSEVTSSSNAMVMSAGLSPTSLSSPDYGDQDMWSSYDDHNTSAYHHKYQQQQNNHHSQNNHHNNHHHPYQHSVITSANNVNSQYGTTVLPPQTTIYPLPSINTTVNGNSGVMNGNGHLNHHTPRSDSANSISSGREDLSPSSSLNGYSTNDGIDGKGGGGKGKKGPIPRMQEELCLVCGDRASGYHYNALTCEGCKGFFRRSVTKNAVYCCKFGHECEMDMYMRRKCQECRLKKCLAVGMRPECVVPETQCAMKRKEKRAQKEKDKQQISPAVSTTDPMRNNILHLLKCEMEVPQTTSSILTESTLAENRAKGIPALTHNQFQVIYKLIWFQDGYEQPSEEDLKRIMSAPEENESQHDISFRHITEITILTVQLIVEFAKGLPAFTKIPQEDQITLLKACSSEVMMLRMARRYDAESDSIFFANNRSYTRDSYKMAGMADNIEDLLHFCRQMYSMTVDNVEYALLTAIVIFSDRPNLEQAELVEAIQSYYIETLRVYILNRHKGEPKCLVLFAKLLSILTELRTLGNQNAEMCFSLKLKNRKIPRFLEEIWDVPDPSRSEDSAALPAPQTPQGPHLMANGLPSGLPNGAGPGIQVVKWDAEHESMMMSVGGHGGGGHGHADLA